MDNKDVKETNQNILQTNDAAVELDENSDKNNHHLVSNENQPLKVTGNLLESTELREKQNQISNQNQNEEGKNFNFL